MQMDERRSDRQRVDEEQAQAERSIAVPVDAADDDGVILDAAGQTRRFGPSDSSDSGSDVADATAARQIGDTDLAAGSDRYGTGERSAADVEPRQVTGHAGVDREVEPEEAALGTGLDQAEEAQQVPEAMHSRR